MKIKCIKILSAVLALAMLPGILAACDSGKINGGDTSTQSMAPADDVWRGALPETSAQAETVTDTYETATTVSPAASAGLGAGKVTAFGGTGDEMFERVAAADDGGYAAIGFFKVADGDCADGKSSWAGEKSMLVKYDKDGKVEWSAFLGGDGGVTFAALAQLADKSFIVAGQTKSTEFGAAPDGKVKGLILKYSAAGKQEWFKTVGGSKNDSFISLAATPDGGFVVGGKAESSDGDFAGLKADAIKSVLIKYDASGNVRWKRALTGTKYSNFEGIAANKDGELFAVCKTMANDGDFAGIAGRGEADTVIFSCDKNGAFNWIKSFSGSGPDELTAVAGAPGGGCVIAGKYAITAKTDGSFAPYHNAGGTDGFIVKYNKNGSIGWVKPFGGLQYDEITGITEVAGGYAATGISQSSNRDFAALGNKGERDGFILLLNERGETLSAVSIAGTGDDVIRAVSSRDGARIFVAGGTKSADFSFTGLSPEAGVNNFNCFSAVYTNPSLKT